MCETDQVAEPGHNIGDRVKSFFAGVDDLGKQSAIGATALSALAVSVVEAAHDGLISPRDAKAIYECYAAASKNAGGTPGSIRTNASKIRKLIELGGQNDGLQVTAEAARIRDEIQNPRSPFEGLVQIARKRVKLGRRLADDEVRSALTKAPKRTKPRSAGREWQAVAEAVVKLAARRDRVGIEFAKVIRNTIDAYVAVAAQGDAEEIHAAETA